MDRETQIEVIKTAEDRAKETLRARMNSPAYRAAMERHDVKARGENCSPRRRLVRTA